MANLEDQVRVLKDMNNELVQEVQNWKMTAAQYEKEKLDVMKEVNELRLKISRLRSGGAAEARKLSTALQTASEDALSHMVQASGAVVRSIELVKQYILDRQELETHSPRWSSLGNTPSNEKVHRVPPTLMGGQSIQPVVALSRTMLNSSARPARSPNVTQRAVPIRMLQDVYIPLTRIDMSEIQDSMETAESNNNSSQDVALDDSSELPLDDSQNASSVDDFETSRRLDAVIEDLEPDEIEPDDDNDDDVETPPRFREPHAVENPLEGPSWLLDVPNRRLNRPKTKEFLEADSTTPSSGDATETRRETEEVEIEPIATPCAFTPTVRRRKRPTTPPSEEELSDPTPDILTPPATVTPPVTATVPSSTASKQSRSSHGDGQSNRVLKVVVAKMRLTDESGGYGDNSFSSPPQQSSPPRTVTPPVRAVSPPADVSPPKRSRDLPMRFDAPSPNGTTDAGVIVSENRSTPVLNVTSRAARRAFRTSVDSRHNVTRHDSDSRDTTANRSDSRQSDSDGDAHDSRTRRQRTNVSYKEKPLNRKMRR